MYQSYSRTYAALFFNLLVNRLLLTPLAVLLELNFACDELAVFARPVIGALADVAGELYELILRHSEDYTGIIKKRNITALAWSRGYSRPYCPSGAAS